MSRTATELYIDLLKQTICGLVYDEPPVPVELYWCRRGKLKKWLAPRITRLLARWDGVYGFRAKYTEQQIQEGQTWPVQAYTMIGAKRMDNLAECVNSVLSQNVPGDFIETGVWRGGACIFVRGILQASGVTNRKVFVADSFRGLPEPNVDKYPDDAGDKHHTFSYLAVSRKQVEQNFRRFGLLDSQVVFLEGWFKDTLPKLPSSQLAVIRLDGDMYESTMDALTQLYPKLSPGGFCIIDDYMIPSCRKAVHDYRDANGIKEPVQPIDSWSVYWRRDR
jgi:O-methyltransferase